MTCETKDPHPGVGRGFCGQWLKSGLRKRFSESKKLEIRGHRKFLGIGYDLSEEFFHSEEEESRVSDPSEIGSEEFDFGIE